MIFWELRDKWLSDSVSKISYHGEITTRPRIEPATPGLQLKGWGLQLFIYQTLFYSRLGIPEKSLIELCKADRAKGEELLSRPYISHYPHWKTEVSLSCNLLRQVEKCQQYSVSYGPFLGLPYSFIKYKFV